MTSGLGRSLVHIVQNEVTGKRLSDYVPGKFPGLDTKSAAKNVIKRGEIMVQGNVASTATLVFHGYTIVWNKPEQIIPAKIYKVNLNVVFEDEYLAIVNKPAGIVVSGKRFDTLENGLRTYLKPSPLEDALALPRAIHRLDSSTSGLVIVAKTHSMRISLGRLIEEKAISKTYHALVIGEPLPFGFFDSPVNCKEALTRFETVKTIPSLVSGRLSLLRLFPETGRTHQIRIHLWEAGFPILGDKLYGKPGFVLRGKGLFLCATGVEFFHPVKGKQIKVAIDLPGKFQRFIAGEYRRWEKYSPEALKTSGE